MKNLFQRLAATGGNMTVLVISITIFVVAFFAMQYVAEAQKAPTIQVLVAAHDLNVGDVIKSDDVATKTVYQDGIASLYVNADETGISSVLDGVVAVPMIAGQPILKNAIVAQAADGTRLSAALVHYPDGNSLFPLPMDQSNIVAPDIASFMPGDMVAITVVIASRPQQPETPTPNAVFIPGGSVVMPTPAGATQETAKSDANARSFPPLAKDLFPQGVRVISIQGLPQQTVASDSANPADSTTDATNNTSVFSDINKPHTLMLLIPNTAREELALALKQGDMLVVSLIKAGQDGPTAGFTYWDFEDLFKNDRNQVLKKPAK